MLPIRLYLAFLIVSGPLKEYGDNILFASAGFPKELEFGEHEV